MRVRYVVERVAGLPNLRRVKDTLKNKYIKHPHGVNVWWAAEAQEKALILNAEHNARTSEPDPCPTPKP